MTPLAEAAVSLSQSPELSMALQATMLVSVGLAAARVAAHARASVRHLLLAATFAAILALPLAATSSPDIPVKVPVVPTAGSGPDRAVAAPTVTPGPGPAGD